MDAAGAAKVIGPQLARQEISAQRFCALLLLITACCCAPGYAQNDPARKPNNSSNRNAGLNSRSYWKESPALPPTLTITMESLWRIWSGGTTRATPCWPESNLRRETAVFPSSWRESPSSRKMPAKPGAICGGALLFDPKDAYANEFMATTYFLEGDLEAALKYWNRAGKPEIAEVRSEPALRVRPALLDHAFAFAPASTLTLDQLLASEARVRGLGIFSSYRFELSARTDGKFDVVFRASERNGFGNTKAEALLRVFGGVFFQEITPEYYNLRGSGTNIVSLARWDPDKRRASAWLSGPLGGDPKWRYRLGADLRNENWTVQTSFTGPSTVLGALNQRRESVGAEISRLVGARWSWSTGLEVSHRDFRNVLAGTALTPQLLAQGYQIKQTAQLRYELWRSPETAIDDFQRRKFPGRAFVVAAGAVVRKTSRIT